MIKRFRQARKIFGLAMLAGTAIAFFSSGQYQVLKLAFNYWNPVAITDFRLRNLSTDEYISEIQSSIDQGDLAEAAEIAELAKEYGHQIPQELVDQTNENILMSTIRRTSNFTDGYIFGSLETPEAVVGTVISDLTVIGDLRDLSDQGLKYLNDEENDQIVIGLAIFGLLTSKTAAGAWAAAPATGGGSFAPAVFATGIDVSASVFKNAKKMGKLSVKLSDEIYSAVKQSISKKNIREALTEIPSVVRLPSTSQMTSALKKIDFKEVATGKTDNLAKTFIELNPVDMKALSKVSDKLVDPKSVKTLTTLATSNYAILKSGGIKTSFKAVGIADNTKDMSKVVSLTNKFGSKTASVLKVLGKNAIKLGKLLYLIGAVLIGVISWLLYVAWLAFKTTKGTIRLIHRAGKRA